MNQQYCKIILELLMFIARYIPLKQWAYDELHSPKYQKFKTDRLPLMLKFEKQNYTFLLAYYQWRYKKPMKPIKRRGGVPNSVPDKTVCPRCGAPHDYIYRNNGGGGQMRCKVCDFKFQQGDYAAKSLVFLCPHCRRTLSPKKDRTHFVLHKCVNAKCAYYLRNLAKLPKDLPETERYLYKLHYIYREFTTNFFSVDLRRLPDWFTSFKFRKQSAHIMGLCLTYHVNLGLSLRKTAEALRDIHGVTISHTMVANYARTASVYVKAFTDAYDYNPSKNLAADETYIKVFGAQHYVWFIMDTVSRSILGYHVSANRGVGACILAMRNAFDKFKTFPKDGLKFIADGYSAYPLAAQQFKLKFGWDIPITPVIGLNNDDAVSKEFRPFKQKIERLNRTFKSSYRVTCGYGSDDGAYYAVSLWVCYYNFLRRHTAKNQQPLNPVSELSSANNMPAKWQLLMQLGQRLILETQTA